jgi:anti-anti-sigma factor
MAGRAARGTPREGVGGDDLLERPQFRAKLAECRGGIPVVVLEGEVDIHTARDFKRVLVSLVDDGRRHIVVDAAQVTFMDSTALGVFLSGERRLRPQGGSIVVVCEGSMARLFEITGLDRVFAVCRTREEALGMAGTRQKGVLPGTAAANAREIARP